MVIKMNVLSLFDGISCGRVALERAGILVDNYFASEIDPAAIKIASKNYPSTIHLGDITRWRHWNLSKIDLILGGSPCQSFSKSGNQTGFGGKSGLFYTFVDIVKSLKPRFFLLENVEMKKEWEGEITSQLGVSPVKINSKLLSAQSRPRLYWANFPIEAPSDAGISLSDILEKNPDPKFLHSEKALDYLRRSPINQRFLAFSEELKSPCVTANFCKGVPYNVLVTGKKSKSPELKIGEVRRFTPEECEKLQTLPVGYTAGISDTQRYKAIGNGWTVDVISHIFS